MHRVLRKALKQAVRWRLIAINPTDAVDPPKVERPKMRPLDTDETAALLDAIRHTRMYMPVLLAVTAGLRRGEILALRWRAINFDTGQISVRASAEQTRAGVREKAPKSGRDRTVAVTGLAIEELRRHKLQQAQELLQVGIRQTEETHVIAQAAGQPLKPQSLTHEFRAVPGWE
jgi:integrase